MLNVDRDSFRLEAVLFFGDAETHDAGLAVKGFRGVEDEIADAVVDLVAVVVLDGLQGVGVVADEHVSAGMYQHVGIVALQGYGLQRVFTAPVERDDDDGCGVGLSESENT